MAKRTMKFKEADLNQDQIVDQNAVNAAPIPASNEEVNQAANDIIQPADVPNETPVENDVKVNPETVNMEVQIPTDQLAAAVAQSTGDVVPAETAPDAQMAQEDELVANEPANQSSLPTYEPPQSDVAQQEPQNNGQVLESKKSKGRVKENANPGLDVAKKKCKQDCDIITNANNNQADSIKESNVEGIDKPINGDELELIDKGVKNMADALMKESEEPVVDDSINDDEPKAGDVIEGVGEPDEDEELDFSKLSAEDEPVVEDDDESIFDDIEDDEETNEFLAKISDFLKGENAEEVADSLRTAADFVDSVAEEDDFESTYEDEDFEDDIEVDEDKLDFDSLLNGAYDEEEDSPYEDADEYEEDEDIEESLVRVPCKFPRKDESYRRGGRMVESRRLAPRPARVQESNNGIKYPAGSEPNRNLVEAHSRYLKDRRDAINRFRESVRQNSRPNRTQNVERHNPRFNEALRSSVRLEERSRNEKAWSNNRCADKFDESNRLDFKKLLEGDWYHQFG